MSTNLAKPESWDADIERSIAFYTDWFLNGYFDRGYLQVEAAERIDWAREYRVGDFEELGL